MAATKIKLLKCLRCGATCSGGKDNPWRPFCSERCKTVDLGDWFSERNRIAGKDAEEKEK